MIKHIIFDLILFLAIILCPWYLSVILAFVILYYLPVFNEIVIFGLIMDILYGGFLSTFRLFDYKFTILFLILLLSSLYIKNRLKFSNR